MFLLLNIIINLLFTNTKGYVLINGEIPNDNKYYISSKISDEHKLWIMDGFDIIKPYKNLEIQNYYDSKCIRIKYSTLRYTGFSDFNGFLLDNNKWMIDKISIGINPNIKYYNSFLTIIIHELLHTLGLFHSDIMGSIMNKTFYILNGDIADVEYPFLHDDDIAGLLN